MMKSLVKTIKLFPYSFNFVTNLVCMILFFAVGFLFSIVTSDSPLMGITYLCLAPFMLTQMYLTLAYSKVVKSSSRARIIELTIPDIVSVFAMLFSYFMLFGILFVKLPGNPEKEPSYALLMIFTALSISAVTIYMSAAYKYFIGSIALFFVAFAVVVAFSMITTFKPIGNMSFLTGTIIGFIIVVIGYLFGFALRRMLYNLPLSKLAAGAALRKKL